MHEWINCLRSIRGAGERAVLVTVAGIRGSAPREIGAKMLVSGNDTLGTIGGGQLEYQCIQIACGRLRNEDSTTSLLRRFPLGANCGQCCGGVVDVLFEECGAQIDWFDELQRVFDGGQAVLMITRLGSAGDILKEILLGDCVDKLLIDGRREVSAIEAARQSLADGNAKLLKLGPKCSLLIEPIMAPQFDIAVFGAGHVGGATVAMLATLDCNIRWIDNRRKVLPRDMPENVQAIRTDSPQQEVAAMPARAFYLIVTHSHALDYEICRNVLNRNDFAYCGLIGSRTKQRRFTRKMQAEGVNNIDRLTCPIGVPGIGGKKPAEIAISVAAEMLQVREAARLQVTDGKYGNVVYLENRT